MNKKQKAGIVRALKAGKLFLHRAGVRGTTDTFICNAIDAAVKPALITQEEADAAIRLINNRLGNKGVKDLGLHLTVECWLMLIPEVRRYLERTPNRFNEIQEYRHRWVDALIEEFS